MATAKKEAVKETVETVKADVKAAEETVKKTAKKAAAGAKKTVKKVADKAEAVKKTAAKKTAAKKTAAKKPAAKAAKKDEVFVEFGEAQKSLDELVAAAKADFKANNKGTVKSVKVYVKSSDAKVYYVVNDTVSGDVAL